MDKIYEKISYDDLLNDYCSFYIQSFGQIEFEKIAEKIQSSPKINDFLKETNRLKIKPSSTDFLSTIHSVLYFTFAKPEKISIAGIILLSRWNKFIAIPNNISDNYHLNNTLLNIINKSNSFKFHLSSEDNFFEKFLSQTKIKYTNLNSNYNPPNVFADIAYDAVLAHIIKEGQLSKIGMLNCYIFYSTYISLFTSLVNIKNTDNVDLYLAEGIDTLFDFLKLDIEDFNGFFNHDSIFDRENLGGYVEDISIVFTNEIKKLLDNDVDIDFTLLFNVDEPETQIEYIDVFVNKNEHYELTKINIRIINAKYDLLLPESRNLKLEVWGENNSFDFADIDLFINELVVSPFKNSRCYICGNFELREKLKLESYSSDGIFPMCMSCRIKNISI